MKSIPQGQAGLSFIETLIMVLALGAFGVLAAAGFSWLFPSDKGPAPLAKEFMSVAYGGKPSDVTVYVKFAPGDQQAVVRAEAGKLSCLLDTTATDDKSAPRFGWLVTGAHCVPRECADGEVVLGADGRPATCPNGERSGGTIEEHTIQVEKCSPESDHVCVGVDLAALRKAAESGEFKVPTADAK